MEIDVDKIKDYLRSNNCTLSYFAKKAKISRECLYKILRGETSKPQILTIHHIAAAMGISFYDLIKEG